MLGIFNTMVSSLVSLLICLTAGFICRKNGILSDSVNSGLSNLLLNVTLPCTIIINLIRPFSRNLLLEGLLVLLISTLANYAGVFIGFLLTKFLKSSSSEKAVLVFAVAFGNVGYMGFPIIDAIYGQDGMFFAAMVSISFNVMTNTHGVRMFLKSQQASSFEVRQIFTNPALIATLMGMIFFLTSFTLPRPVLNGMGLLASMTTPLSMLIIGSLLAKSDIRKIYNDFKVYPAALLRLVVIPILVLACKPLIHNQIMLAVLVILAGMPSATLLAIFAERYGTNAEQASKIVFITTVFSLFTIPLLSILL
jgi:predicted permease